MRLLLDTNVLADYYSRRQPYFKDASRLRVSEAFGDVDLWACGQSFADIEYVFRSSQGVDILRRAFLGSTSFLHICMPSSQDVEDAFSCGWPDLEDYLIYSVAHRIDADYIITRDEKGFLLSSIPAISPSEFFDLMRSEYGVVYDEVEL